MDTVEIIARTDYDFTGLAGGKSATIPLCQCIDLSAYPSGSLALRLHEVTWPAGASVSVWARQVSPSCEDPALFFRGPIVGAVKAAEGLNTAPSLVLGALDVKGQVGIFLLVEQAPAGGTFTFTISVAVVPKPGLRWTPRELGSKVRLWLDNRDLVTVAGEYSDWGDQSPSGTQDFTQGTAGLRPLTGKTINYAPAPDFRGSNDYLVSGPLSSFVSASAYHVFVVMVPGKFNGTNPTVYYNDAVIADIGAGWWGLFLKDNGGTKEVHGFHWAGGSRDVVALGAPTSPCTLVEWSYDGTTLRCQVGGNAIGTAAGGGAIGDLTNNVQIGYGVAGSVFLNAAVASIIVCNEKLSAVESRNVRDYLSSTYGAPI